MNPIHLTSDEIVDQRPFTHPGHTTRDLQVMRQMWSALRKHIQVVNQRRPAGSYDFSILDKENGEVHQIVLANRPMISQKQAVVVVGYFGQTRPKVDHTPIIDLENELIQSMDRAEGLLVYYNCYWPGSGWGNLVLFANESSKQDWGGDAVHQQAVALTPRHYFSVRLHNGLLPAGIFGDRQMMLTRTKYLDFSTNPPWRAVRSYSV